MQRLSLVKDGDKWLSCPGSFIILAALILGLFACSPHLKPPGKVIGCAMLTNNAVLTSDGSALPLHIWPGEEDPKAVLLALHGFNDYGRFIKDAANFFSEHGVQVYSYDQRGFGRAPYHGFWPGKEALTSDLTTVARLLTKKHPGKPIYLLGTSMGGAVIMTAMAGDDPPSVTGTILIAPAVRGRSTMPFYHRWVLALAVRTLPWLKISSRGLNIKASDNDEMLMALGRDPLIIKETRVDAIWGLVNLMDVALESSNRFDVRALILYGAKDQIILKKPTEIFLSRLPKSSKGLQIIKHYEGGYHMLLRDLEGETVWWDILKWITPIYSVQ